jgi:hypothetical protein
MNEEEPYALYEPRIGKSRSGPKRSYANYIHKMMTTETKLETSEIVEIAQDREK